MRTECNYYRAGDPGRVHLATPWMDGIWAEREELQLQSKDEFTVGFYDKLVMLDRFEIAVFDVTGSGATELKAAAVVTFDEDVHVGLTLSVEVAYSDSPGLGKILMREFHRLARDGSAKTIRVIKRTAAYTYTVRYVHV
jgi:hypothetical protein